MIGPEVVEGKARPLYIYAERAENGRADSGRSGGLKLSRPKPIFGERRAISVRGTNLAAEIGAILFGPSDGRGA